MHLAGQVISLALLMPAPAANAPFASLQNRSS